MYMYELLHLSSFFAIYYLPQTSCKAQYVLYQSLLITGQENYAYHSSRKSYCKTLDELLV